MKHLLTVALPLYVLDQTTKALILMNVGEDDVVPVIPGFFNLVQVHNTGAAFGMLSNNNLFFMGLSSVALIVIGFLSWRGIFRDKFSRLAVALLISGVAGNLTDRILHGYVVDFLDFILPWYGRWPAFNVADSCICVAALLFIISSFLEEKSARVQKSSQL